MALWKVLYSKGRCSPPAPTDGALLALSAASGDRLFWGED